MALHTCMLCEAVCGVTVDGDGVRGDPDDPFSRGHICPKAAAIPDVMGDPDRLRAPQRKDGHVLIGSWVRIKFTFTKPASSGPVDVEPGADNGR